MAGAERSDEVFHVDLRGVVDLLSHHLYSSPRVYLRELLQNATDALTARAEVEADPPRRVRVVPADVSVDGRLHVIDTGIGLDEAGIRSALATIGASTKRDALGMARETFLGRFGIGLLSCFLVTDEVVVDTRAVGSTRTLRWRGRDDGGYDVGPSPVPLAEPGTDVSLRPRGSAAELLTSASVVRLATTYARHLPLDLVVETPGGEVRLGAEPFPWEGGTGDGTASAPEAAAWCRRHLGFDPLGVVHLADPGGGVRGIAFILPRAGSPRPSTLLHAKRMLVAEHDHDLLPAWAGFVHAVADTSGLDLTASREALRDDDRLAETRERLGEQLRRWLLRLSATDPEAARAFFRVHHLGAKAMAASDDAMLEVVATVLPWETTVGTMTLAEFGALDRVVTYVDSTDHYDQVAAVARAQDVAVLNAGYAYDAAIVRRWVAATPGAESRRMQPEELLARVDPPAPEDDALFAPLLDVARGVLARARAVPVVRRFRPSTLQALLLVGHAAERERDRRGVAETTTTPWAAALEALEATAAPEPSFVLNADNPAVRRLAEHADESLQRVALEALYAQALLAGRHPLTPFDSALVARALPALIDRAVTGGSL